MNKFSFINQLLQKEKFTASQKERVLKLVTKELTRVEGNEQHILNEIQLIKEKIGLADEIQPKQLTDDEEVMDIFDIVVGVNGEVSSRKKAQTPSKGITSTKIDNTDKKYSDEEFMTLLGIENNKPKQVSNNKGFKILTDAATSKPKKIISDEGFKILIDAATSIPKKTIGDEGFKILTEGIEKHTAINGENKEFESKLFIKEYSNTLEYTCKKKENGEIDPRITRLEDKKEKLSNIYIPKNLETSLLENIYNNHANRSNLDIEKIVNKMFFLIAQKNVNEGIYEKIEISRDTYIIPEDITQDIIDFFDKNMITMQGAHVKNIKGAKNDGETLIDEERAKKSNVRFSNHNKDYSNTNLDRVSNKYLNTKEKFHNPKKVNEWLQYFTIDNTAIKFSTHPWDDDLYNSYQDYISGLMDEHKKYDFYSLQKYSTDLYWNKIYPFLFQNKPTKIELSGEKLFGWGRYKIGLGWQYPNDVKSFCKNNFDGKGIMASTPLTMELPKDRVPNIPGKTLKTFEDVVNIFKNEIEFRQNSFWVGVKTELQKNLPNHNVNKTQLDSLKGCSFYTNTENILKAISRIFKMIKSRSESQSINISCTLDCDKNLYVLEILHLNSYSDMHIHHPKLIAEKTGDISILRTTLLSLCDFSIESRFKDDDGNLLYARIDYLYDEVESNEWKPYVQKNIKDSGGFKFILKFLVG
ncbi:hypothetical protein [Maribacter ulvicola]|uniref:Histidine Kinase domain-containing protein n=1 Tax=Maribacter ulvicola TaxID=228959 RepID=A0A1N6WRS9_9FLAO|nr:hypothetical protein [Maribacter ulvicola]SIQ92768.1 hypothetical protein SAMN05421797_104196 [Maribacter ulvicola]